MWLKQGKNSSYGRRHQLSLSPAPAQSPWVTVVAVPQLFEVWTGPDGWRSRRWGLASSWAHRDAYQPWGETAWRGFAHTHIYTNTHTHIPLWMKGYSCTCKHLQNGKHTQTHIYTHTHTHTKQGSAVTYLRDTASTSTVPAVICGWNTLKQSIFAHTPCLTHTQRLTHTPCFTRTTYLSHKTTLNTHTIFNASRLTHTTWWTHTLTETHLHTLLYKPTCSMPHTDTDLCETFWVLSLDIWFYPTAD